VIRVALLHNIISPHVVPLFRRLAAEPDIQLKVYFLAETDLNRRWATEVGGSFDFAILPHRAIRVGRQDLHTFFINPTILQQLRRDGFDVVISAGWDSFAAMATFALCKVLRKPFILWSGSTINEPSWRRTLTLPLVRAIVRGSDGWIAYGSRARDYLVRLGAPTARVSIAYNTVDVEWFQAQSDQLRPRREELRGELGLSAGPVILYVGQLIVRKGALDLLNAHEQVLQRLPSAQLVLVGYGPLEPELRAQVAARRITGVTFAGHVKLPDLPRYYAVADVFVLPSHEEVWGLVLNEAAASGLPLLTTDVTGAAADLVVPGRNGKVVPPQRPDALAAALMDALENATEMGAASRELISTKTYTQNVDAIASVVRVAAARYRRATA
jgi:glycosyltransferase involved in cell wall biosynthesis